MIEYKYVWFSALAFFSILCSAHADKTEWQQIEDAFAHANTLALEGNVEGIKALKDSPLIQRGEYRKYNLLANAIKHDQLGVAEVLLSDGDMEYWIGQDPSKNFSKNSVFVFQSLKKYYPEQWDRNKDRWLTRSIEAGDEQGQEYLLAQGATLKKGGKEALIKAILMNDFKTFHRLRELGAEIDAGVLHYAYNLKALELLEMSDEAGIYRDRITMFKKEYPEITNPAILGTWEGPGEWGIQSAEFRSNATGAIYGAIMPVWLVLRETPNGADLYGLNPDSGEISEVPFGELHLKQPSKAIRSLGGAVALRRNGEVIYFMRHVTPEQRDTALAKQDAREKMEKVEKPYTKNLRKVAAAGQQYILEEGVASVSYKELVGIFFEPLQSVNGESYEDLVVHEGGGELEVVNEEGETFKFKY